MVILLGWLVAGAVVAAWWTRERRRAETRAARLDRLVERADSALASWNHANRRQAERWEGLVSELYDLQHEQMEPKA
jgi:hypothetical protein